MAKELSPEVLSLLLSFREIIAEMKGDLAQARSQATTRTPRGPRTPPTEPTVVFEASVEAVEYEDNGGRPSVVLEASKVRGAGGQLISGPWMVTVWAAEPPPAAPIKVGGKFVAPIGGWQEIRSRGNQQVLGWKARYLRVSPSPRGWVKFNETPEGLAEREAWAKKRAAA